MTICSPFFRRTRICISLTLSLTAASFAPRQIPGQSIPTQPPVHVTQSPQGFIAAIGNERLHLIVCSDSILHVTTDVATRPDEATFNHPQPWLLPPDQSCKGAPFQFSQDEKLATLKTATLTASISLSRGNLTFTTSDGKPLAHERDSVPRTYDPVTINGDPNYHVVDRFAPDFSEALYGLGQHQSGMFNYRGSTVELGQNNTDIAIPFLVSTKGYGIIWNTAAFTYVDNRFPLELSFDSMAGDGVDYFILYGPQMDDIIHQYRNLTGHAPMLPRWAYGFIQSKDRYTSLDEIISIANRYRAEHIPMDVMVQDWFWWKHEGDPIFNDNYHDVPADLKKLHDEHVHTMISTWGLIDPAADTYKKLDSEGLLSPAPTSTTPQTPRRRASTGTACPANSSPRAGTPFGSILQSPKNTGHTLETPSFAAKKSPSATELCTPTSIRSCTTKEFNVIGARRRTRSAPSSSRALPFSANSE